MYPQYFKELWGINTVEKEGGFATYLIDGKECLLEDMFVLPGLRRSGICFQLADKVAEIAKSSGCSFLTCKTRPSIAGFEGRKTVFLKYGFKEYKKEDDMVYFVKELT